jgi:hypothetical protein
MWHAPRAGGDIGNCYHPHRLTSEPVLQLISMPFSMGEVSADLTREVGYEVAPLTHRSTCN